jgi:hypothetical protein
MTAIGTQREPRRDLPSPGRGASEQQTRHVGAADQEHEAGNDCQQPQEREDRQERARHAAERVDPVDWQYFDLEERRREIGNPAANLLRQHRHRRVGLRVTNRWPQPAHHFRVRNEWIAERGVGPVRVDHHPEVPQHAGRRGATELEWHHTRHFVRLPVERQDPADDLPIAAEAHPPDVIGQDDQRPPAITLVVGSPQRGAYAEHREEIRGGHFAGQPGGHILNTDTSDDWTLRRNVSEQVSTLADLLVIRPGHPALSETDAYELGRCRHGKGIEQQRIHDGEHGRVRTDRHAER